MKRSQLPLNVHAPSGYRFLFSCIDMDQVQAMAYCKKTFVSAQGDVKLVKGVWRMRDKIRYRGWYFDADGGYTAFVPVKGGQ